MTSPLLLDVVSALRDKKAIDILVLDVRRLVTYTDYLILCSGGSGTQVRALVSAAEKALAQETLKVNSSADDSWWVLDQVDLVVHVFREDVRAFYDLETLWADAPTVELPE
ncbi:MAG: ribosome silencing factor [bacterium]